MPPASLWRTGAAPAGEQWRGIRLVRGWVTEGKLLSGAGKQQPLAAQPPPPWSLMPLAGKLWGLPEALPLGLAFLWGWQSEPILHLSRLGIKRRPGSLKLTASFQVIILN